jgi:outer membrane protein assembly factor BamB
MQAHRTSQKDKPRLRTGAIIVILTLIVRFGIPSLLPEAAAIGVLGGLLGGLVFLVWWVFFSGGPRKERWIGAIAMILSAMAFFPLIHDSIGTAMQGMMYPSYVVPTVILTFFVWALVSSRLSGALKWAWMIGALVIGCGAWTLLRSDGISGHAAPLFTWRWSPTSEEMLLASSLSDPVTPSVSTTLLETEPQWPGFRGPERDSRVSGTFISDDWEASPPQELWRRTIGPGCSSFAIHGNLLFTQEQRGEEEIVSCYTLDTGNPVWMHSDRARFWDSHAGAGPRSTPTVSHGRIYTCGATGILNVLNEKDGALIWSRNAAEDAGIGIPGWGYTSSPLVMDSMVMVAITGTLLAYDIHSGERLWTSRDGGSGYSSPHFATIDGVGQILLMTETGIFSIQPKDGSLLWQYDWPVGDRILQPALLDNGEILVSSGSSDGIRRLRITSKADGWKAEELWSASLLKSTFNDLVVQDNYAYGFSGPFLECVDIVKGERTWKGGRYGGQLVLLSDQDLLLILTEKGEIALVKASPEEFTEIGRIPVIEGKTWNHPVLVGDLLLVRNSQEMVALRL